MLKKIPIRRKLFQCTLMLLILLYLLELADLPLQARPDSRLTAGAHRYTAVVRQIREKEDAVYTLRVRLCSMDDAPLDGAWEALLTYYQKIEQPWLLQKSKIRFTCSLRLPQSAGNPHCFDYADYLKSCGITLVGTLAGFESDQTAHAPLPERLLQRYEQLLMRQKFLFAASLRAES